MFSLWFIIGRQYLLKCQRGKSSEENKSLGISWYNHGIGPSLWLRTLVTSVNSFSFNKHWVFRSHEGRVTTLLGRCMNRRVKTWNLDTWRALDWRCEYSFVEWMKLRCFGTGQKSVVFWSDSVSYCQSSAFCHAAGFCDCYSHFLWMVFRCFFVTAVLGLPQWK